MPQFAHDHVNKVFHLAVCAFGSFASISILLYIILFHHIGVFLHLCLSFARVRAFTICHCLCIIATRFSPTPTLAAASCTSIEVSTQAARPGKKAESSTDGSRCSSPSAPVQGPVIYAQLDHSGSKNSFHKMEPVVYADIRKN
ncbi:hypothetical protein PHYPO_G00080030 [Pangasianodon hypophthalmus]|uniref:Uncharacterized protein n=1 Tax=Pangasianodon hypophthalmus TaxID=310915 RepID=A0A5N5LLS1_PANHP|nr:hypothetical protein PHYPO_G00080030 [Pangasianodon hypophthalmus]